MENHEPIVKEISNCFSLQLEQNISIEELRSLLTVIVNDLIQKDFQKLVNILYRIDISETKLKTLLKEHADTDAGLIIANLIVERQMEKINSRKDFKSDESISEDEKW